MPGPQHQQPNGKNKKKKKGRAPAHQNSFAYRHNPKSTLTDRILSSPNVGTCRRCRDKIEWRKRYRKYRPRTQPGACNSCRRRNVLAAYHTVCGDCCWSSSTGTTKATATDATRGEGTEKEKEKEKGDPPSGDSSGDDATGRRVRMCAVCTKEPALTSSGGDDDAADDVDAGSLRGLKLRERRTVERNVLKEKEKEKELRRQREGEEGDAEEGKYGEVEEDGGEGDEERNLTSEEVGCAEEGGGVDGDVRVHEKHPRHE